MELVSLIQQSVQGERETSEPYTHAYVNLVALSRDHDASSDASTCAAVKSSLSMRVRESSPGMKEVLCDRFG